MKFHVATIVLTLIFASIFSAVAIIFLFHAPQRQAIEKNIPGMDGEPETLGNTAQQTPEAVKIGAFFSMSGEAFEIESASSQPWPHFRGERRDNICREPIKLKKHISSEDIIWSRTLGEGHASAAIYDGQVFILDYLEDEKADALIALTLESGKELWRRWYKVNLKRNHGFSRTIPAVSKQHVVSIGPAGQLMCVRRKSGDLLWAKDLEREFESRIPEWYNGQCPLIDGDVAVIAPAGKEILMFGVECESGKLLWSTPNELGWKMSHSSIVPMNFAGKKFYVYCANGGICGVSAEGDNIGKVLWATDEFKPKVFAPSPVPLDNGIILATAGYGAGGAVIQIRENNGEFSAELIKRYRPGSGISSEQQTPIFFDGHIFSVMPKDAGEYSGQFVCASAGAPEKILWGSGSKMKFGLGPYILADGRFYLLKDDGVLCVAEASSKSFNMLSETRLLDGVDAWGPIAISGGYMIIRDSRTMKCINLKE